MHSDTTASKPHLEPWLLTGLVATGMVMLNDLGRLLADTQAIGSPSYSAWVFTGPKFRFWNTDALGDAVELWRNLRKIAQPLLILHTVVDAALVVPWYWLLIRRSLEYVGAKPHLASLFAGVVLAVDAIETLATGVVIAGALSTSPFWLGFIQLFSLTKWLLLAAALMTMAALWVKPDQGVSAKDMIGAIALARDGGRQHPGIALLPLIALVTLFGALIAVPAGGPLEQIPDVLRFQLSEGDWWLRSLSGLALFLLASAVASAGLLATDPGSVRVRAGPLPSLPVLGGAAGLSLLLFGVAWGLDEERRYSPLSFLAVALGVALAGWLADWARGSNSSEAARADPPGATPDLLSDNRWVGALSGAVIVAGGLGLVRAAFPPLVLDEESALGAFRWWAALALGIFGALRGGSLVQRWVEHRATDRSWSRLAPIWGPAIVAAIVAGWLLDNPTRSGAWGTTGVVAIGFSAFALVLGVIRLIGRACPVWPATLSLGFGRRTPWLTLLAIAWAVASLINTEGVYHDARVMADLAPSLPRHTTLDSAFQAWLNVQTVGCSQDESVPIPLVLVAAPGGGIRAAYWTAATLDRLFGTAGGCAGRRLFAVSGVSGGSVGAATWMAASAAGSGARQAVERMSRDSSLAAAAAGLLLRDFVQPFVGVATNRLDRAALLENGWTRASGVFGSAKAPVRWRAFGREAPWVPVVVLNASSVTDGCRVLIANVGGLPASTGKDCGAYFPSSGPAGPVSASIDPFPGLHARSRKGATCGQNSTDMRMVTAALLSARFPLVTPSGALLRCVDRGGENDTSVTYVVDGGYFENSGLLTLLQIWYAVAPSVRAHNSRPGQARRRIVPWIVVADNHYRDRADAAPSRRPLELLVLYQALTGNRLFSQGALEQQAMVAMGGGSECSRAMSAQPESEVSGCFAMIAPSRKPAVAAPLGWVLSPASRADLNERMDSLLPTDREPAEPLLAELLRQLR